MMFNRLAATKSAQTFPLNHLCYSVLTAPPLLVKKSIEINIILTAYVTGTLLGSIGFEVNILRRADLVTS